MTCDTCGAELHIGDYPFCPHDRGANTVIPDDVPGGFTVENGFPEPQTFYSKTAHRRALDARGLQQRIDNRGPDDKICPRWDTVDLEGAAQLVQRGVQARQAKRDDRWKDANIPISVRIIEGAGITRKDLV